MRSDRRRARRSESTPDPESLSLASARSLHGEGTGPGRARSRGGGRTVGPAATAASGVRSRGALARSGSDGARLEGA